MNESCMDFKFTSLRWLTVTVTIILKSLFKGFPHQFYLLVSQASQWVICSDWFLCSSVATLIFNECSITVSFDVVTPDRYRAGCQENLINKYQQHHRTMGWYLQCIGTNRLLFNIILQKERLSKKDLFKLKNWSF